MSFRDQIVAVLAARPGISAAFVKEALEELGVKVAKNEPAGTLNVLKTQGRVRHEGDWPARIYFAVEGVQAPAKGGSKPKAERAVPKPRPAKLASELDPHNVRAIPASRPVALASAEDIVRAELGNTILGHLQEDDNWDTAEQIATDLTEPRQKVSLAIADLMRQGRVTRKADATGRWVYRDRRAGDAPDAVRDPEGSDAAAQASTLPLTPTARAPKPNDPPRLTEPEFAAVEKFLAAADQVLGLPNLPGAVRLELTAIDDLLGEACDAEAPHAAIKGLVVAQGALRRVLDVLQPAARAA